MTGRGTAPERHVFAELADVGRQVQRTCRRNPLVERGIEATDFVRGQPGPRGDLGSEIGPDVRIA